MAHAILIKGGGGVGGSDEVTVMQKDVPKGLTAITADSNDEIVEGSLETTVSDAKVLSGETYYNTSSHDKRTGTMANYEGATKTAKSAAANGGNIDFTVNDTHANIQRDKESYEGLIKKLWESESAPAVVSATARESLMIILILS